MGGAAVLPFAKSRHAKCFWFLGLGHSVGLPVMRLVRVLDLSPAQWRRASQSDAEWQVAA